MKKILLALIITCASQLQTVSFQQLFNSLTAFPIKQFSINEPLELRNIPESSSPIELKEDEATTAFFKKMRTHDKHFPAACRILPSASSSWPFLFGSYRSVIRPIEYSLQIKNNGMMTKKAEYTSKHDITLNPLLIGAACAAIYYWYKK